MNSDALLHWLLRTSLEASILILAVVGLRMMLGARLSPAWRIGLWMLVGTKLMLPAFIPAGFGIGAWFQAGAAAPRSASITSAYSPESPSPPRTNISAATSSTLPEVAGGLPTHSRSSLSITQIVLAAWLAGAAAVLGLSFIRQQRFNAFLRRRPRASQPILRALIASLSHKAGLKKGVSIVLMPAGTTPAMVGIRQPKLLLPEDWDTRFDERSLRHVVLHELLHVKQHDLIWNWVATAVQALHWFNPLVWFVVSRFQADRELRCDAGALEILAPSERLEYGHTLLRIQETFLAPPAIAGLAPCVRNHPTLRQRILMIAQPTTRQPWIHALLVLTLSVFIGYSFTTARAVEKEIPPKVREGTTTRPSTGSTESEKKPAMQNGEREGGKPSAERDGQRKPSAERDGEKKPGMRDGEKNRTGSRDGEGMKKPGAERDAGTPARKGDGEGRKPSAESGQKPRQGEGDRKTTSSGEVITLKVIDGGDTILIGDEKVPANRLRGFLMNFLPDHPSARVEVTGNDDIPLKALHNTVDAVRDNGNKNVGIKAE